MGVIRGIMVLTVDLGEEFKPNRVSGRAVQHGFSPTGPHTIFAVLALPKVDFLQCHLTGCGSPVRHKSCSFIYGKDARTGDGFV